MRYLISFSMLVLVAGCAGQGPGLFERRIGNPPAPAATPVTLPEPGATASGEAVPPNPNSVGEGDVFQTAINNPDEDGGPAANAPATDGRIGTTVATLGDPAQEGFWVKTPLVSAPTAGRVVYVTSGRSVQVQLLPLDGPAGGGSEISMAAMRLLDAPLTGLPELVVYSAS